ncbi:MAG TPA: hypothetical protein VGG75_32375 [Trebonia sp.]
MPNGAVAPGNVSPWPTVAPPEPVPIIGSTSEAGSLTRATVAPDIATTGSRLRP